MRLLFVGFGVVGQGLAELLLERGARLAEEYGLDCSVVGIADTLKGSCCGPEGIDLGRSRSGNRGRAPSDGCGCSAKTR